jgi:ribosomal protein L28
VKSAVIKVSKALVIQGQKGDLGLSANAIKIDKAGSAYV